MEMSEREKGRLEERERCVTLVEHMMPRCKCAYLKGYSVRCQRCILIGRIKREGRATRG